MVERGRFPIFFTVAGFAFLAKNAFMIVVFLMARVTISLELVFIQVAGMAAFTFGGLMLVS